MKTVTGRFLSYRIEMDWMQMNGAVGDSWNHWQVQGWDPRFIFERFGEHWIHLVFPVEISSWMFSYVLSLAGVAFRRTLVDMVIPWLDNWQWCWECGELYIQSELYMQKMALLLLTMEEIPRNVIGLSHYFCCMVFNIRGRAGFLPTACAPGNVSPSACLVIETWAPECWSIHGLFSWV